MKNTKLFSLGSRQRGFTLVELIVAISISALLGLYAQSRVIRESEEALAAGSAKYLSAVANAAQAHVLTNWNLYSTMNPVPGVAVALQPTLAELQTLGRLSTAFPINANGMPTRQSVRVDINPVGCPGAGCTLTVLACTTTPVTLGGPNVRFDLASTMVEQQNGAGGQSLAGSGGATIRGPIVNAANPVLNTEGIVCGTAQVDTALYQQFVRIGDVRDPNLAGPLTVAGVTTINGATTINNDLTVTGTMTAANMNLGPCINMNGANGRAGFGCQNGANLPAGYTGGVRSVDVVANGNILASDNPAAFTGANTNFAVVTANNGTGAAEVRTSGRAVADRLVPSGTYVAGGACTDDGAIARSGASTGLLVCQGGLWRNLTVSAAAGDACPTEGMTSTAASGVLLICMNGNYQGMNTIVQGATAGAACPTAGALGIDTSAGNATVICRANPAPGGGVSRWLRLQDITSNLSFVTSTEVTEGTVVAKPTCTAGSGMTSLPLIQLIPKTFSSADGGFAFYVDTAASWTVRMRSGAGTPLAGTPYAVAHIYCYYP